MGGGTDLHSDSLNAIIEETYKDQRSIIGVKMLFKLDVCEWIIVIGTISLILWAFYNKLHRG